MKHGGKIGVLLLLLSAFVTCSLIGAGCNALRWGHEASETIYQETRPQALLKKYRHFKTVAAQLDKIQADIALMDTSLKTWEKRYANLPVEKWPRHVSEQYDQRLTEVNAVKANFNMLAAEYNKAMSDMSFAFCNVGSMPKGFPPDATALKRSYATYVLN